METIHGSAAEIAKAVNVLDAINWIHAAWSEVKEDTIKSVFRHVVYLLNSLKSLTVQNQSLSQFSQ